jgi:hypothetical protein
MFISVRIRKLLEILKNYSPARREKAGIKDLLSGLIFVNEWFIAFMIKVLIIIIIILKQIYNFYHQQTLILFVVKICPEDFGHLHVDFLFGLDIPEMRKHCTVSAMAS